MSSPPSWAAFGLVASPTSATPSLVDAPGWSHYWRKGGPMLLAKLTSRWSHVAGGRHSHAADSGTLCVVADHTAVAQRASGLDRSEPTGRRQGAPRIGRLDFVRRMPQWNLDLGTGRRERTTTRLSRGFGFLFVVRTLSQTHGQGTKEASRRYATGDHSSGSAVSDKNVTARHEAYGARPSLGLGNVRAGTTGSVSDPTSAAQLLDRDPAPL